MVSAAIGMAAKLFFLFLRVFFSRLLSNARAKESFFSAPPPKGMNDVGSQKVIKCVIVGNSNVGKTSLMDRLVNGSLAACPHATIGVECRVMHLPGRNARVRFWDTAGMEQFDAITKVYYRGVDCAIVCYSEQDDSIRDVATWVERIRLEHDGVSRRTRKRLEAHCCEGRNYVVLDDDDDAEHHVPILLVATKVDHPLMCNHHEEAVSIAEELCLQGPVYTSSRAMTKKDLELLVLPFVKTLAMGRVEPARGKLNIEAPAARRVPCCPLM
jgi:GTPase SAR1 family protein